jgi:hypothetical protein
MTQQRIAHQILDASVWILDFLVSRTVRNKFVVYKLPNLEWYTFEWSVCHQRNRGMEDQKFPRIKWEQKDKIQNLWNTEKAVLRRKLIFMSAYIKKSERDLKWPKSGPQTLFLKKHKTLLTDIKITFLLLTSTFFLFLIQVWYIWYIVRNFVNVTMYSHPAQQ